MSSSSLSSHGARSALAANGATSGSADEVWTRRRFLKAVGLGLGAAGSGLTLDVLFGNGGAREALAGPPLGANEGVVVLLTHYGGNDGLNTVVPFTNDLYYRQRGSLAVQPGAVLALDNVHGLHSALPTLHGLWTSGRLAVVHGVGYPNPDLSHFVSMAIWMKGSAIGGPPTNGWVGRWLDGVPADMADLAAVTIDSSVSVRMQGRQRRGIGVSPWGDLFGAGTTAPDTRLYAGIEAMVGTSGRGALHDAFASAMATQLRVARQVAPALEPDPTGDDLVRRMTIAARLINADVGVRFLDVPQDGFDHHDNQPSRHPTLLGEFDEAISVFFATLDPALRSRVIIVTASEFGRTPYANLSSGTDHGTANVQFVIGEQVRGGHYGEPPSLALENQWGRLLHTVDFRSVFATVLDQWMYADSGEILEGRFESLGFLRAGPGHSTRPPLPLNGAGDSVGLQRAVRLGR